MEMNGNCLATSYTLSVCQTGLSCMRPNAPPPLPSHTIVAHASRYPTLPLFLHTFCSSKRPRDNGGGGRQCLPAKISDSTNEGWGDFSSLPLPSPPALVLIAYAGDGGGGRGFERLPGTLICASAVTKLRVYSLDLLGCLSALLTTADVPV